jgi:hypothetical protein
MKKFFRLSIYGLFLSVASLSFSHALVVEVPSQQGQEDVAITGPTQIQSDEGSIFDTIQLINKYLWFAISVVCMGVLVFGGFKLMTASGDEKKMEAANKILT